MKFAFWIAPLACALVLVACSKKPSSDECDAMLDRYLDLSMAPDVELSHMPREQAESVILAKKAERRASASFVHARARCEAEVSRDQMTCAMQAPTANDWEACID